MRTGVLSDASIKKHCPELWPLQSDKAKLFHNFAPHTHPLSGIKHRYKEHHTFARYPVNDFNNYALLQFPGSREQAEERAIMNYRLATGSQNIPESKNDAPVAKAINANTFGPFQITSRMRSQQVEAFKKRGGAFAPLFSKNAQAYIGSLDYKTESLIIDHFANKGSFNPKSPNSITAHDIHEFLYDKFTEKDQRMQLSSLLQQSRVTRGDKYLNGLRGVVMETNTGAEHTRFVETSDE